MPDRVTVLKGALWRWAPRVAVVVVLLVALSLGLRWASSGAAPQASVEEQWYDAVNQLGIEPVYPPAEDLAVGDIVAIVTGDTVSAELNKRPIHDRALTLMHLDLTQEIVQAYQQTYQFPATVARPPSNEQIWNQTSSVDSLFKAPNLRQSLPIVVFPAFSLHKKRAANGSAGGFSELWDAAFGGSASSDETVDVHFAGTETYGIPAITAETKLIDFCNADATSFLCTDDQLRKQLSIVIGANIYQKLKDEKTGQERWRYTIELALVNRVFLARAIETRSREASRIGGSASTPVAAPGAPPAAQPGAGAAYPPPAAAAPSPPAPQGDAVRPHPGVAAGFENASSMEVSIPTTVLPRPVAIGFKSVRWVPQGDEQ